MTEEISILEKLINTALHPDASWFTAIGAYSVAFVDSFFPPAFKLCNVCKYNLVCLSADPIEVIKCKNEKCPCFVEKDYMKFYFKALGVLSIQWSKGVISTATIYPQIFTHRTNRMNDRRIAILTVLRTHFKEYNLTDSRIKEIVDTLQNMCDEGKPPFVYL